MDPFGDNDRLFAFVGHYIHNTEAILELTDFCFLFCCLFILRGRFAAGRPIQLIPENRVISVLHRVLPLKIARDLKKRIREFLGLKLFFAEAAFKRA